MPDAPQPPFPFALRPRQASLREALAAVSPEAAGLYLGGLMVLADDTNPAGLRLAAAAMRELIDQLAKAGNDPLVKAGGPRGDGMKGRVNQLQQQFERLRSSLEGANPSPARLQKLLRVLDEFFRTEEQINPKRRDRFRMMVASISVGAADAQAVVINPQARRLHAISGAFSGMLHGGDRAEFDRHLDDLEDLLLTLLTPPSFDDFDLIDELLANGAEDA